MLNENCPQSSKCSHNDLFIRSDWHWVKMMSDFSINAISLAGRQVFTIRNVQECFSIDEEYQRVMILMKIKAHASCCAADYACVESSFTGCQGGPTIAVNGPLLTGDCCCLDPVPCSALNTEMIFWRLLRIWRGDRLKTEWEWVSHSACFSSRDWLDASTILASHRGLTFKGKARRKLWSC